MSQAHDPGLVLSRVFIFSLSPVEHIVPAVLSIVFALPPPCQEREGCVCVCVVVEGA